jgi:hypothetical protein
MIIGRTAWIGAAALAMTAGASYALDLVKDGRPLAGIWFEAAPTNATGLTDQMAAEELAGVVQRMSGAALTLHAVPPGTKPAIRTPAIVLGQLAALQGLPVKLASRAKDGFRIAEKNGILAIAGESSQGVYHGVYDLLETWGCGWYVPGEVGEVIPRQATLAVAGGYDHAEVSDSINRRLWYGGAGNRATGGERALIPWRHRNKGYIECGSWNHAWGGLVPQELFETQPELFGIKRGQRNKGQLCTSNQETVRIAAETLQKKMAANPEQTVFAAGPNDGGGLCECEACAKMHTPGYQEYTTGKPCYSDAIFKFASDIADITAKRFPDKDLGILVYSEYSRPLKQIARLNPRVFPMMAPIRRCRIHGPGNPVCPSSQIFKDEIFAWAQVSGGKLGFYPYNYNLADSLLPFTKFNYYKRLIATVKEAQIKELAWIPESMDSWTTHAPHLYLCIRMLWNTDIDVDAELDRFFKGFYGRAAEPMRDYWRRIDAAYAETPAHAGSSYGQHRIWTPELLKACRADIEQGLQLAGDARETLAVEMADAGLRCAEGFMDIWNHLGACEFQQAAEVQACLKAFIAEKAAITNPPSWFHERYAYGYFETFVGRPISGGAQILANGGKILVKLPDVWKFSKDETSAGVAEGWFKPDFNDSTWTNLATFSRSWCDQGLDNYLGDAWYRTAFSAPQDCSGDLRLWFGGFDENIDVYLNGASLGEKKGFVRPAEYAGIATQLKPGLNVLAVRVSAGGLAELGTGGLMMPAMIYRADDTPADAAPKAKDDGKPAYEM